LSKALVTADLHCRRHGIDNMRMQDGLAVLDAMLEFALVNKIKYIYYLGDIWHQRERIDAVTFFHVWRKFHAIKSAGIIQHWIVGNHDWVRKGAEHTLEPFRGINNSVVGKWEVAKMIDFPLCIISIAFCDSVLRFKKNLRRALKKYEIEFLGHKAMRKKIYAKPILMMHQGVSGYTVGSDYVLEQDLNYSDLEPDEFSLILSGHYHKYQQKKKLIYVGAPYQHDFGERDNQPGFVVLDFDKKDSADVLFVELDVAPRFVRIEKDNPRMKGLVKGNFVQVTDESLLKKVKKFKPRKLVYVPAKKKQVVQKRLAVKPTDSLKEVLTVYVEKKAKKKQREEIQVLGLKILEEARQEEE